MKAIVRFVICWISVHSLTHAQQSLVLKDSEWREPIKQHSLWKDAKGDVIDRLAELKENGFSLDPAKEMLELYLATEIIASNMLLSGLMLTASGNDAVQDNAPELRTGLQVGAAVTVVGLGKRLYDLKAAYLRQASILSNRLAAIQEPSDRDGIERILWSLVLEHPNLAKKSAQDVLWCVQDPNTTERKRRKCERRLSRGLSKPIGDAFEIPFFMLENGEGREENFDRHQAMNRKIKRHR